MSKKAIKNITRSVDVGVTMIKVTDKRGNVSNYSFTAPNDSNYADQLAVYAKALKDFATNCEIEVLQTEITSKKYVMPIEQFMANAVIEEPKQEVEA